MGARSEAKTSNNFNGGSWGQDEKGGYYASWGDGSNNKEVQVGGHYFGQQQHLSAAQIWNHPLVRAQTGDIIHIGVGYSGIAGIGAGSSIDANWILRGPGASVYPVMTVTQSFGAGYSLDATVNVGSTNYIGPVEDLSRTIVNTDTFGAGDLPTVWGSAGLSAGGKLGGTVNVTQVTGGGVLVDRTLNAGAGLPLGPVPLNFSGGVSNTFTLRDFAK